MDKDRPTGSQATLLGVASGLGAASNFVIMLLMTRTLDDPRQQAEALAFWSVLTGLFGVLVGVQNETARATAAVSHGRGARGQLIVPVLLVGITTALVVTLASPRISSSVLPSHSLASTALLVATALGYAIYALVLGAMAGARSWRALAATLTAEVVVRMAAVALVALTTASLLGFEVAMTAAVGVVLAAVLLVPRGRHLLAAVGDQARARSLRQLLLAVVSSSATAVMITGYPALMKAGLDDAQLAAWMLAVSITRAPIMMPLATFQQVAVTRFVFRRRAPLAALAAPVAIVVALGGAASVGAGLFGSWILRLFNPDFAISGTAMALLALASTAMAALVLVGTAALAADGHRVYAAGWTLASVVSIALLFGLPVDTLARLLTSLVVGPAVGVALILGWLLLQSRRNAPSTV